MDQTVLKEQEPRRCGTRGSRLIRCWSYKKNPKKLKLTCDEQNCKVNYQLSHINFNQQSTESQCAVAVEAFTDWKHYTWRSINSDGCFCACVCVSVCLCACARPCVHLFMCERASAWKWSSHLFLRIRVPKVFPRAKASHSPGLSPQWKTINRSHSCRFPVVPV